VGLQRLLTLTVLAIAAALAATTTDVADQALATVPGGTNILHVPMSWCVVRGTPAQAAPNITSEGSTVADTNTNALMWRRHERPTDNVYLPQASVSLRSSINNSWGTLSFPLIDDPDTAVGQPGDVVATVMRTTELTTLETSCEAAYAGLGRAGIGITAVNVGLWRDPAGAYTGQTGLGGCSWVGPAGSPCSRDFFIFVADNHWFYPTVPNRNIPGFGIPNADPLDLVVAHETGHALNLQHRNNTAEVMNPSIVDTNGDGRVDNKVLNTTDVATMRASAQNVPGLEVDPPGEFQPGPLLAMHVFDGPRESPRPGYLDLSGMSLTLDTRTNSAELTQRLWGLLPCRSPARTEYQYYADLDNRPSTGAAPTALSSVGLGSRFRGADLVAKATVVGGTQKGDYRTCRIKGSVWAARAGSLARLRPGAYVARIRTMRSYLPHYPVNKAKPPRPDSVDLFNMVEFRLLNRFLDIRIRPKATIRVLVQVVAGGKVVDRFTGRLTLEYPSFPHCFPSTTGTPGGTADITFDGLRPNREIHALLGPNEVLRGVRTDASGSGRIQLPIPKGTSRGKHLVTIGHDGLALTADCTLTVV